jgi:enolase-phosphatase E1
LNRPYAHQQLETFLRQNVHDSEVRFCCAQLKAQRNSDAASDLRPPPWREDSQESELRSLAAYAQWLMAQDSKFAPLKTLQGRIGQQGYASGKLRGQVYDDVPRALQRWRRQGKQIYTYSSGSVLAQKLLFQSTCHGDLTLLLSGFFDANIGGKTTDPSYRKIASQISCATREVLFFSDAAAELNAARRAGMHPAVVVGPGHPDLRAHAEYAAIRSFDEVYP